MKRLPSRRPLVALALVVTDRGRARSVRSVPAPGQAAERASLPEERSRRAHTRREGAQPRQSVEPGGAADRGARLPVEQPDGGRAQRTSAPTTRQHRRPQPVPQGRLAARRPRDRTVPAVLNVFDNSASDFGVSGRVTALAVDPTCGLSTCRVWMAAAGGGIWRSDNALASDPQWTFLSNGFGTNAIGTLVYDAKSHTLYAGTGEPNSSGDSEAGVGIYASHDNGNQWTLLPGSPAAMNARSISSIVIDPSNPNTMYVGTTRGVRGVSSVTGGSVSLAPDAAPWGLWKTTNGGQTFTQVWDGHVSAARRQRRRDGQPRDDLRGCVPAGHLALDERRLHVGAGLRDAGSRPRPRHARSSPSTRRPAGTPGSTWETAAPRPTVRSRRTRTRASTAPIRSTRRRRPS